MRRSVVVRHVEVRSWPERPDIMVIDQERAMELAHYDLEDVPDWVEVDDPVFDPLQPWAVRARHALRELEQDQERLSIHFEVDPDFEVRLAPAPEPRRSSDAILRAHDLSLDEVELPQIQGAIAKMRAMPVVELWELMADWYDRMERRYPVGTSRGEPRSWVHRAHPDRADHFTHLADGDRELARELFQEAVDVPITEFSLYPVIQWVYFSRTEFAGEEPFPLTALDALTTPRS